MPGSCRCQRRTAERRLRERPSNARSPAVMTTSCVLPCRPATRPVCWRLAADWTCPSRASARSYRSRMSAGGAAAGRCSARHHLPAFLMATARQPASAWQPGAPGSGALAGLRSGHRAAAGGAGHLGVAAGGRDLTGGCRRCRCRSCSPAWRLAFVAGCVICGTSARRLGVHDHGGIVFDEIVGHAAGACVTPRGPGVDALAFLAVPRSWISVKPWPIREADHRIPRRPGHYAR